MDTLTEFCKDYALQYVDICIKYGPKTRVNEVRCNNHAIILYDDCRAEKLKDISFRKEKQPSQQNGTIL
jgi:hypothetical protein